MSQAKDTFADFDLAAWLGRTATLWREVAGSTRSTLPIPKALRPLIDLLSTDAPIDREPLAGALDELFAALYRHPLTRHSRTLTAYLRARGVIPDEAYTENLIHELLEQLAARSPVPIPPALMEEFWTLFRDLLRAPELKGLTELQLEMVRLVLRGYEPMLVELINLLKEARRVNQGYGKELLGQARLLYRDLAIIRRQIRALRYIKPFFQTAPQDFPAQARIIARMVREFGPFFIKLAQVAAANADVLPEEIARELRVFQEDVAPMTPAEVLSAFQECYGKSPAECYQAFDLERPLKSGSIGSVYLAQKRVHGRRSLPVIVKVGRYNLEREFVMGKTTIGLMLLSSQFWAPHSKLVPFLEALAAQVDEFARGFARELDFRAEAAVQARFARRARRSRIWGVPEVYAASARIIEMEYLEGAVSVQRAVQVFAPKHPARFRRRVAEGFIHTLLTHVLVYRELHGDLHPGNVLVTARGKIYLIDWGNAIDLSGKWQPFLEYLLAVLAAHSGRLADALIALSTEPERNRRRRAEIVQALDSTLERKAVTPLGLDFIASLRREGMAGLHRRMQTALHLIANTQRLGIVIRGDYLHLARSLLALSGTCAGLYEGLPKLTIALDVCKTLARFPANLVTDRLKSKPAALLERLRRRLPFGLFPS